MSGEIAIEEVAPDLQPLASLEVVLNEYNLAKVNLDNNCLRQVLYALAFFLVDSEKMALYRLVLLDNWHQEHDELISALQIDPNKSAMNADVIKWNVLHIPDYLNADGDIKDAFVKKCLYALVAQTAPESLEALMELQESDDEIIKKQAVFQLQKLQGTRYS